jgi:hypothetical protein
MPIGANDARKQKLAKAALAKANTVSVNVEGVYEDSRQQFNALSQNMGVTYDGNNNVTANQVKSDTVLNNTHRTSSNNPHGVTAAQLGLGNGHNGTITVVTSVDFTNETTTTSTLTITNGIITGVS